MLKYPLVFTVALRACLLSFRKPSQSCCLLGGLAAEELGELAAWGPCRCHPDAEETATEHAHINPCTAQEYEMETLGSASMTADFILCRLFVCTYVFVCIYLCVFVKDKTARIDREGIKLVLLQTLQCNISFSEVVSLRLQMYCTGKFFLHHPPLSTTICKQLVGSSSVLLFTS